MRLPHSRILSRFARPCGAAACTFALAWTFILAGAQPLSGAESVLSQCVACHTDAAKLKALTPPDPPPTEEGEG